MKLRITFTAAVVSIGATSCAFNPPVGVWDHDTAEGYIGYDFRPDGRCAWIAVAKKGGVGLGSYCSYSYNAESGTITIFEYWGNSGVREKPEKPELLKYDRASGTVIAGGDGGVVVLQRALTLQYNDWR